MARIRTIKPELFRHRELQDLGKKHGPELILVYIGLWTQCDRAGNFLWDVDQLGLDILPFLGIKIEKSLEVLRLFGFIIPYQVGKNYGHIPKFSTHQLIFGSEAKYPPKFPPFNELEQKEVLGSPSKFLDHGVMELRTNGVMDIRREGISRFTPPLIEEVKSYCTERKNSVNPEKWLSHYESNGWMVGKNKMKDWKAAVRTWENNEFGGTVKSERKTVKVIA